MEPYWGAWVGGCLCGIGIGLLIAQSKIRGGNYMKLFVIENRQRGIFLVTPESKGWTGSILGEIEVGRQKKTVKRYVPAEKDLCGSWKPKYDGTPSPIPPNARNVTIHFEVDE